MAHFVIQWPVELCSAKKLRERFRKAKLGQNLNNFRSEFLGTEKFFGKYLKKLTTLLRIFWGKQSWERERKVPKRNTEARIQFGSFKVFKETKTRKADENEKKTISWRKVSFTFCCL